MSTTEHSGPPIERLEISHFQGYKVGSPLAVRSAQSRTIGGYAAVFGKPSENLGGFFERVHPQAFNKSKSDGWPNVVCRWNHRDEFLLGTTRSGTLQLKVDNLGLDYQVDLPECRNDILEMTARGDLAHSSFAFQTYSDDWMKNDGGYPIRMLLSCRLIDTAPVTSPAYPDATVGLRSFARFVGAPYEDVVDRAKKDELRSFWQRTDSIDPRVAKSTQPAPEAAEPGGRDPHEALAELDEKRYGPKQPNLYQERLKIEARVGDRIAEKIRLNDENSRDRQLTTRAAAIQREARETERRRVLEHQWRMGQLTEALDGPLAVERDEARQRQATEN